MSHDHQLNMADQELDDFAFDEQGIYREVPSSLPNGDQGINLDEDGVWRDDLDHWSHHTYRTYDSGIAINDHRSSSSTINRLPQVTADVDPVCYGHESNTTDSLLHDEKSLNISELEASESMLGEEISFEQRSFHSDENLDLPELVDESYLVDSESSKDLHAEYGRDSVTDHSEISASKISYHDSRDYDDELDDLSTRQPPEYVRPDLNLDLELLGRNSDWMTSANGSAGLECQDNIPAMAVRKLYDPKIEGESLFTQEEPTSGFGGQSLVEFEELEAEVQTHLGDAPMDNLDLIGAYLHGLTQQEADDDDDDDDDVNDSDPDHHQDNLELNADDDGPDVGQTCDKLQSDRVADRLENVDESGDQKPLVSLENKVSQSDRLMNSHECNQQQLQASATEQSCNRSDSASLISKIFQEEDHFGEGLLENEKPPFDTQNSLEMPSGLRMDSGPDEPYGHNSPRLQSRIPMLRSRSPLMSRPGSCSPRVRARSMSPAVTRKHLSQLGVSPHRNDRSVSSTSLVNKKMPNLSSSSYYGDRTRSLPQTPLADRSQQVGDNSQSAHDQNGKSCDQEAAASSTADENQRINPDAEENDEEGSIEDLPELSSHDSHTWRSGMDFLPKLSRHSVLQKFKMTSLSQSSSGTRSHPIKATGEPAEAHSSCDETYESEDLSQSSVVTADLKRRFLQEKEDRKEKEMTLEQLQKEYNDLLKKHATAENLIDELRLGAKVTLYSDGPNAGQAQMGSMPPAQHGQVINIPQSGTATVAIQQGAGGDPQQGVLSDSHLSNTSTAQRKQQPTSTTRNSPLVVMAAANDPMAISQEESSSIAEEGTKLSLFAQAKSVEEQVQAFQILLKENSVSLDEQERGLLNVKASMEKLQQAYRDAKSEHEYRRRRGTTGRDSVFDPDKEVEGELYKLSMTIDDLEHTIQENLKKKFTRIPFQHPVRGDHNILMKPATTPESVNFWEQADCEGLSPRRPPSVGSIVGVSGDIDKTLHQLHKDYNALMDRYRKLKQLKKTPETDQEISNLLKNLKAIFEQTPDHRKPALPPELESLYNPVRGTFMTPDQLRQEQKQKESQKGQHISARQRQRNRQRVIDTSSTALESSDISSPERGHHRQSHSTLDKESVSSSTRGDRSRRRRPGGRQLPDASSSSFRDSDWSTDHHYHGDYSNTSDNQHRINVRQPNSTKSSTSGRSLSNKVNSRSSHRDDKDSGYMGSEGSRKRVKEPSGAGSTRERQTRRGPIKTSALRSPNPLYSDSDSASTVSTVEECSTKHTHRTSSDSRATSQGANSTKQHHNGRQGLEANSRSRHSESEEVSMISGNRNRNDVSGQNVATTGVMASQGSAFQVKQTRPPLIQPRPLQPTQVAPITLTTGAGMAAVSAPQYQYQYPAGSVVQAPGMVPVSGVTTMQAPVQTHYGPVLTQPQPQMHFSGMPQPQPSLQAQPMVSSYNGVQAPRPVDQVIADDLYGRGRSRSFGGERSSGFVTRGLQRGRYRSTQALSGRYDDDRNGHDQRDFIDSVYDDRRNRSRECYDEPGSRYTDRVWESHAVRDSPYDYRKRFEQIREERYGHESKYKDADHRRRDCTGSEDSYSRRLHRTRHRKESRSQRRYDDDYLDYDDIQGYYSDPESPDQYTRSRRYYQHPQARTPDHYRSEYYDGPDDYVNEYDTGPLDEKYLTNSGIGASGVYNNPGTQYSGSGIQAGGFPGAPFGGIDMATRGIQNVPHMTTTGVQYVSESAPNPGPYAEYAGAAAAANAIAGAGIAAGTGIPAVGQPLAAAAPAGYGYQVQGMTAVGQMAPGLASSDPTIVMAAPAPVTSGLPSGPGAASYVPVQVVQTLPPAANETVPTVLVGGATAVGGASPAVLRVLGNGKVSSPKVRYYIREYGAESDAEVASRKRNKTTPRRGHQSYDDDLE